MPADTVLRLNADESSEGLDSGENARPSDHDDRSRPCLRALERFTSRISTSMLSSARGLSFIAITRSIIWSIGTVARTVTELATLFAAKDGRTPPCWAATTFVSSCSMSPASALER